VLYEYSVNGNLVRSVDISKEARKGRLISAIAVFGRSFWQHRFSAVVGTRNGKVLKIRLDSAQNFQAELVPNLFRSPVSAIDIDNENRVTVRCQK
jgi:hypothetical protein